MAKFQLYKDINGQYRWRLRANNSEIIAHGEAYASKQNAINAIALVMSLSPNAGFEDLTQNSVRRLFVK